TATTCTASYISAASVCKPKRGKQKAITVEIWTKKHETIPNTKHKNTKLDQQASVTSAMSLAQHRKVTRKTATCLTSSWSLGLQKHLRFERAHRSLALKPGDDQRLRPVIVRFHSFPDNQRVIAAVWQRAAGGDITIDGIKISFNKDFIVVVLCRPKEFAEAKKCLREIGA
ncbi:hypothetical protein GOODEAATRI_032410, partial [Goodea atripinnis]